MLFASSSIAGPSRSVRNCSEGRVMYCGGSNSSLDRLSVHDSVLGHKHFRVIVLYDIMPRYFISRIHGME